MMNWYELNWKKIYIWFKALLQWQDVWWSHAYCLIFPRHAYPRPNHKALQRFEKRGYETQLAWSYRCFLPCLSLAGEGSWVPSRFPCAWLCEFRVPLLLEHWIKICTPIACSCYTLRMLWGIIASVSLWVSRDGKCRTPVSTYGHVHTGAPAQRVCFSLPCSCSSQDSLRTSELRRFRCYMIIINYIYVFISYSYYSS